MFFLLVIIVILIAITILMILSTLEIKIENLNICIPKINDRVLNNSYKITISFNVFKKYKILKLDITKTKLEKLKIKDKSKILEQKIVKNKSNIDIEFKEVFKKLQVNIEELDLQINIGTEDAALTSYSVGIVSSILALVLRKHIVNNKQKFLVNPVYINKNLLNIKLDCIIKIELIHIIYIIYILLKKRREKKYVRTSNRRSYGYSYE